MYKISSIQLLLLFWGITISFTSNGVLTGSVIGGNGGPLGPVVNPKGGGFVILERLKANTLILRNGDNAQDHKEK